MEGDKMEIGGPTTSQSDEKAKYDWKETIEPHLEIALIGKSGCGKTSLILAAKNKIFPHPDERLVTQRFCLDVEVDGKTETCMVTEGDFVEAKECKIFSKADVVLLCFNREDSNNIEVWLKELKEHMPKVPIMPVLIKKRKWSEEFRVPCGFPYFMVCRPHARKGVKEVFQRAVKTARKPEMEVVRIRESNIDEIGDYIETEDSDSCGEIEIYAE